MLAKQQQVIVTTSKMSALGEMAGGIAHEINNPLAAIRNLSGQLQEVMDDDPIDRALVKGMALRVEQSTSRIAKIVQGLRSFSRDGSQDPVEQVQVFQLVEETLNLCKERFKNQGIEMVLDPIDSGLSVEGRPTELSQVLLNLLNNAHDAVEALQHKWIRVSAADTSDGRVEIQVTDSGSGVSPQVREKLFQPFFTTKEIGKGTGIGLSISRGLIQRHHGELTLDPECGNTRFLIRLPKTVTRQKAA